MGRPPKEEKEEVKKKDGARFQVAEAQVRLDDDTIKVTRIIVDSHTDKQFDIYSMLCEIRNEIDNIKKVIA